MTRNIGIIGMLMAGLITACTKPGNTPAKAVAITVVTDCTDPHVAVPSADPILALYDFPKDKNKEALLRIRTIKDRVLTAVSEFHLPSGQETERHNTHDDLHYREKLILSFYDTVRTAISHLNAARAQESPELQYSECYTAIAEELIALVNRPGKQKHVLCFSDLQENSVLFNCYLPENQTLLKKEPEKVAKIFSDALPLPASLPGITVFFVYEPATREEDQRFAAMVKVYSLLLEPRGVKVIVQAQSDVFKP